MKKHFNDGNIAMVAGILAFCYFLYLGLNREHISGTSDLVSIEGTYERHSFLDKSGYKSQTHQYYIWIVGYGNPFQIKADYLSIFNKVAFEHRVRKGDRIKITYPKFHQPRINTENTVFLTSVRVNDYTYLNKTDTLSLEQGHFQSNSDYYIGLMFLAFGIFGFVRYRLKRKTRF